jgi:hypothetical protein
MKNTSKTRGSMAKAAGIISLGGLVLLAIGFIYTPKSGGSEKSAPDAGDKPDPEEAQSGFPMGTPMIHITSGSPPARERVLTTADRIPFSPSQLPVTPAPGRFEPNSTAASAVPPPASTVHDAPSRPDQRLVGANALAQSAGASSPQPNPGGQSVVSAPALSNPLPGAGESPSTPAPAPSDPGPASPIAAPSQMAWRLLSQLAVLNHQVSAVLVSNLDLLTNDSWASMAGTLVSEELRSQDGLLISVTDSQLASTPGQIERRIALIQNWLEYAPAQQSLQEALVLLLAIKPAAGIAVGSQPALAAPAGLVVPDSLNAAVGSTAPMVSATKPSIPAPPSELGWRLLAQLAVASTNVTAVLAANQSQFPAAAWATLGDSLVADGLRPADMALVRLSDKELAKLPAQTIIRRAAVVTALLDAAPPSAQSELQQALTLLTAIEAMAR